MNLNVVNETNKLKKVVLGIANNLGEDPLPSDCIDPKTKHYLINGEYPLENNCIAEIENYNIILICILIISLSDRFRTVMTQIINYMFFF